jgi:HSP20 family protein
MLRNMTDPFHEMDRLRARLRGLLDATYAAPAAKGPVQEWAPPTDVWATDSGVRVEMELCGLTREEIDVTVEANVLTIGGTRATGAGADEEVLVAERPTGSFSRSFALAFVPGEVAAKLADGVLTVEAHRA